MALPKPSEARRFYRPSIQRFDDAQLLLRESRTTGAVYLAGYTVECILKALVLANVPRRHREEIVGEFRGNRAHNLEWLGALYRRHVGLTIPRQVTRHLLRVASWSTDLRNATGVLKQRDAEEFIDSVVAVFEWTDGRM
jgi:HEPN domain-containing protein